LKLTDPSLYLLDTNILSDMMRNPMGTAAQKFRAISATGDTVGVCTSVIVQCELLFGLRRRTHPKWQTYYELLMESLTVMPFESVAAVHYAKLRTELEEAGTLIGPNDTFIAAHALALGATLVSADAEFARVQGLKLENWLVAA
jgi:tRNA(fMet)-specific endonuclease VapC